MGHSACKPRMAALTLLVLAGWTACRPGPARTPRAAAGFIAVVGASEQDPLWPILKTSTAWFRQFAGEIPARRVLPIAGDAMSAFRSQSQSVSPGWIIHISVTTKIRDEAQRHAQVVFGRTPAGLRIWGA